MSLKNDILEKLEQNKGVVFSGEELARELCVSRAAVWKAVASLKDMGHIITGVSNKGYTMAQSSNLLTASGIGFFMGEGFSAPVLVFDSIDSTNTYAKQHITPDTQNGTIVVAKEQTGGRGRFGRSFFSKDGGVYMSVILTEHFDASNSVLLTISACVAVCKALETLTGETFSIKWVNDIYYKNRKFCGILTEAVADFETGTVSGVVVGVGINLALDEKDMPEDIKDKAGSLKGFSIEKNQLVALVARGILDWQHSLESKELIEYYRARSFVLGKEIEYTVKGKICVATATHITESGALEVLLVDGKKETLSSGEISVRVR